ncbi:MAG: chromosome partitioning protein ParA [Hahellaceae bacterium]|nr:chromosome partitioning protein ParA [Hahellaceae bacterium]MCP5210308.1 chromosome partitioning protein ParA [Hahellaceae bacterium]
MDNKNAQSSADNEQADQTDKTMNVTEAALLNKQQELKELEDSLTKKETVIAQREQALKAAKDAIAQKEAELNDKRVQLEEMELQAKNGFPQLFEEKFAAFKKQLEQREAKCVGELESLESEKEKLRQRELAVQKAEIQRDKGYADVRAKLDDELAEKQKAFDSEVSEKRKVRFGDLEIEIEAERKKRLELLSDEMDAKRTEFEAEIAQQRSDFLNKKQELDIREQKVEDWGLEKDKAMRKQERLDDELNAVKEKIEEGIQARLQSFDIEKSALNDEVGRLRESIKTSSSLISNFEELKRKLGDEEPAAVLLKLKTYEEEIKELRDDIATRPTQEMQEAFERLKSEKSALQLACERLSEENQNLRSSARAQSDLEMQLAELTDKNKSLQRRFESVDAENNRLMEELKRLQSAYVRESDFEKRKINIEKPYIEKKIPRNECLKAEAGEFLKLQAIKKREGELSKDDEQKYSDLDNAIGTYEHEWLDNISRSSLDYGLKFPRRILHAFHTALKTSEWSPVTVLAGVSGTGKSELPRLYSHFGGINFLSLSVQPNWDSQESMLGFFNSIDNEFDAQEVLRFLVQSQRKQTRDNPFGLEDAMSLILMDEMNLAHVELYFAEFLSKLELRRGLKEDDVPSLPVKLGVGSDFIYPLSLGRNVLWAGTMNQDETTKSLSDKVLDRGIVINFPRPTTLERRRQLKPLGDQAPLLSRKLWESWWCRESKFNDDQISPFKLFIEDMNTSLSKVGRALGHRVWQSIEYYMANYPDVLEAQRNNDDASLGKAMKVAFEDQLVQKVMPKLRGIETRGKSKSDCLDKIRTQLVNDDYTIIDDFDLACEFGYGQFIWNSANYLNDDKAVNGQENAEN